ncbi:DNA (cytosine-5-)-methyltransferase [Spiroplasma culicicola]|uniref:Cytosine-specific methyltransferase n=1 Tax=Spiroplasma culicicola AES-1 TaxID=1276246 RepID=W6A828_9MOLU|nr:DNA (cytosine-5-)-methyltransferase [Spiroplasma culicicola]AHI53045.1 DNA-methyltransferase [Spiroplasma culicicola AES-1]
MNKKIFETFAGIGSQAKALEKLSHDFNDFNFSISNTCEWYTEAILGYSAIHNDLNSKEYKNLYEEELDVIISFLETKTLSSNSKEPLKDIKKLKEDKIRKLYASIKLNNNLIDITKVKVQDINAPFDLLTYSFPCQDLSIAGKGKGMSENSNTRSSLLWNILQLLNDLNKLNKLPEYLVMENVPAIKNSNHIDNLNKFKDKLNNLGYTNVEFVLNAIDYGIPQNRKRYFLISKLNDDSFDFNFDDIKVDLPKFSDFLDIENMKPTNRENQYLSSIKKLYSNVDKDNKFKIKYKNLNVYPTFNQANIVTGLESKCISTVTFSGENSRQRVFAKQNNEDRVLQLGAKENILLMGFDKDDYFKLKEIGLSDEKIRGLAGNSIVVNVLYYIFKKIFINCN